jgi:hypothetical protein
MEASTLKERALEVVLRRGIARGRDFDAVGVTRATLQRPGLLPYKPHSKNLAIMRLQRPTL